MPPSLSVLAREPILKALRQALEPLEYVHAMWEGGAAAFGRVDAWSDIDLHLDVDDERVADAYGAAEVALVALSPIRLRYEIPQPTWHGHWQVLYRLRDASEFLLIDLVVMKHSNPNRFLEPEFHGKAVVHFDKRDVTKVKALDRDRHLARLRARVETLRVMFSIFQILTEKELNRGNMIEALHFYQNYTLRPLVEALRIKYTPFHYNFHARYVHYELPGEVVKKLEALFFIRDGEDLRRKRDEAERWFHETLDGMGWEAVAGLMAAVAQRR